MQLQSKIARRRTLSAVTRSAACSNVKPEMSSTIRLMVSDAGLAAAAAWRARGEVEKRALGVAEGSERVWKYG